jgi:hypothetical protein
MEQRKHRRPARTAVLAAAAWAALAPAAAWADEGGASAWLPGQFASFAATPGEPGFGLDTLFYVRSATASASRPFPIGVSIAAGYQLEERYVFVTPNYTFSDRVLNGQLWLGVTFVVGRADTSVSAVLSAPVGTFSASSSDWMIGAGDINPLAMLRWQAGNHNFMHARIERGRLGGKDYAAAALIVVLVTLTALPGALAFLVVADGPVALRSANLAQVLLLFAVGYHWARYSGAPPWRTGGAMVGLGVALVAVAVALGG